MGGELARDIERLLSAMAETQRELAHVYHAKRQAIRDANAPAMDRLTETEQRLVSELEGQLRRRSQILQRANPLDRQADSLDAVVRSFPQPEQDHLLRQIEQVRVLADSNRRESWIVWIVCKQSLRLFGELLDLVANGGRKSPFYSFRAGGEPSAGGTLLDASA